MVIRRFGEPLVRGQRYGIRPGVYAILALGRDVLLTYQEAPVPEFQLPGGGIDPGESALSALHREVAEETGWSIATPRRLGAFCRFAYMPEYDKWAEKICHIYVARPVLRRGAPSEPGHAAVWTPIEAAISLAANEGERHFLERHARCLRRP